MLEYPSPTFRKLSNNTFGKYSKETPSPIPSEYEVPTYEPLGTSTPYFLLEFQAQ